MSYVGKAIKRKEDPRRVSGSSSYIDDITLPGTLHMAFARSIHAHARIKRINVSKAQKLAGVHSVITAKDIPDMRVPVAGEIPEMKKVALPLLASGKVIFVGQPIAAVLAGDKYVARDAAELIEIEY